MAEQYAKEIGIVVVPSEELVYLPSQDKYVSTDLIKQEEKCLSISGTELRRMLREGEEIP